jgi:deferrochelatase/peroxidase EfeB
VAATGAVTSACGDARAGASTKPAADGALSAPTGRVIPFHGPHQAGITTSAPAAAIIAAFDVVAADRAVLASTLRTLTTTARSLAAGQPLPPNDPLKPPLDNLILGPHPPADDLSVTVSVGASLFDGRYGLGSVRPTQLVAMPRFPNDQLLASQTHGDLLLQICGGSNETCIHALRLVMRATRDSMVVRWMIPGFNQPNHLGPGRSSTRNLLGFKDGTANPRTTDADLMDGLVWVQPGDGEPAGTVGGSYHVVRIIRMRVEFWDRTALRTQETIIGRMKDTGAPLDGKKETDVPDFAADPDGSVFRLDGHIRLANPRTAPTERNRILRRGFSYSLGFDDAGHFDQGLLFQSFQRDLEAGFVTVQNRLNGEALEEYITPVGGGYFFALPGVRDEDDWYGQELLG